MLGNVLNSSLGDIPFVKGVCPLGSNVSVCAMPPPIQSTMTVSAVGLIFGSPFDSSARSCRGKDAANAERVAALAVFRKSRRFQPTDLIVCLMSIFLLDASFRRWVHVT